MKPRMGFNRNSGYWYCFTPKIFEVGRSAKCPFIAYMRWMEKSIEAGEQ